MYDHNHVMIDEYTLNMLHEFWKNVQFGASVSE